MMIMENRTFINVRSDRFREEILLETSGKLTVQEFLEDIVKILNWPIEENGKSVNYTLRSEEKEMDPKETILAAGIGNFETVWISPTDKEGHNKKEFGDPSDKTSQSSSTPYWQLIPIDRPSLIHPNGYLILLDKPPILIGRKGGKRPVQVDLSEFEKDRLISSREHAEIILNKGEYALRALNTRNGTFINRLELKAGEIHPIHNNDILQFGSGGVRLVFRKP